VDAAQRIQVHRLVQDILRDIMPPDRARETLRNAQRLLATANPGDPDEQGDLESQAELGPHLERAKMIYAEDIEARQVIVDHVRYLYIIGDYENSLRLATEAEEFWAKEEPGPLMGPDGNMTLVVRGQIANAKRVLGQAQEAQQLARETYDQMRSSPRLGDKHEFTLILGNQVGHDLRINGNYSDALEFDKESLGRHQEVFGPTAAYTLRSQSNLAVDLRMIGEFVDAFEQDRTVASHWEDVGGSDPRALAAYINMARNYYGMGAYKAGLEWLEQWRAALNEKLGAGSSQVLIAERTYAILLRKLGQLFEARAILRDHAERAVLRFGEVHEFANAAVMSHANVLRQTGDLNEAATLSSGAVGRYRAYFGDSHPLTLAAQVNQAIILRSLGEHDRVRQLNQECYDKFTAVLGPTHPYTTCAGASLATDLALAGEHGAALELSEAVYQVSQAMAGGGHEARDGAEHPYLLMRGINLSHDLRAVGRGDEADRLYKTSLAALKDLLGAGHPEVQAIERGERTEGDIEPPPT
jgi:tetratricopeptide (TPR) repeat protein